MLSYPESQSILTLQYSFVLHYGKILKFILVYFLVWLLKEWTLLQNSVAML